MPNATIQIRINTAKDGCSSIVSSEFFMDVDALWGSASIQGRQVPMVHTKTLLISYLLPNQHFEPFRSPFLSCSAFSKNPPLADSFIESRCQFIYLSVSRPLFM